MAKKRYKMKIIDFHTHLGISTPWVETEDYNTSAEELIDVMNKSNINKAYTCANPVVGKQFSQVNRYIGKMMKKYPEHIGGFCRVDPRLIIDINDEEFIPSNWEKILNKIPESRVEDSWLFKEIRYCIEELNFSGIKLNPAVEIFAPDNPKFNLLYELALALDVPIQIHADRINHFTASPIRIANLAERFPELKICAIHLYSADVIDILAEYENVYLEISEVAKGRLITKALQDFGSERIIFGSDYPYGDPGIIIAILNELNINIETREKILYRNAEKLLGNS